MNFIQTGIGLMWVAVGTLLYLGQFISTVNFPLAQRHGLQEKAKNVDPLVSRLELMTARCDLTLLWISPVAGGLMLLDHTWWPAISLIAGGVYLDAGARELAKIQGLRSHGVPIGSGRERIAIYGAYAFLSLTGLGGIALGLTRYFL